MGKHNKKSLKERLANKKHFPAHIEFFNLDFGLVNTDPDQLKQESSDDYFETGRLLTMNPINSYPIGGGLSLIQEAI